MNKEFYNTYNNLFSSQANFDKIYRLVEAGSHVSDEKLRHLVLEDGILFYKKDGVSLRG